MKKLLLIYLGAAAILINTGCLKSNPYAEDFSTTQPVADIPKAPANAVAVATAPTNSWFILDSTAAGVDYATAVHLSAKDHVGDVTLRMKIDKNAANTWITNHSTAGYALIPDSLYTVKSLDVTVPNAGVFSTGDFIVHINSGARDAATTRSTFKTHKYILPVTIESAAGGQYTVASNFQTVLWYIRVK